MSVAGLTIQDESEELAVAPRQYERISQIMMRNRRVFTVELAKRLSKCRFDHNSAC